MKAYRFSPIKSKEELFEAINHIHFECNKLCKQSFGKYLPNAGNMGIFCHYDNEYEFLINIRKDLTEPSNSPNQKYFTLYEPVVIPAKNDVPETTYKYLYIRKPDPYRHHVGDLDFYLEPEKYKELKQSMIGGRMIKGARVFDRQDLDMIELYDPDVDVLGYVSTEIMSTAVRIKLSDATKL
ncbi:hypothetical protein L6255_03885 [Candidatus Parcubacteria bacterium]|nr:hypothetical protein [Patescibacteria group bacterium]MCG2689553.1 hypothetical protein [Candidatus Parcubacteria bacterium]